MMMVTEPLGSPELFSCLDQLCSCDDNDLVIATCIKLLNLLNENAAFIEIDNKPRAGILYDQGCLTGKVHLALTYCIKRILKGMSSTSVDTLANFATALRFVLCKNCTIIPGPVVAEWIRQLIAQQGTNNTIKLGR